MKNRVLKTFAAMLLFVLVLGVRAQAATSGSCGSSATWTLNGSTLTISGSGAMYDYSTSNKAPWNAYTMSIGSVVIGSGITKVGNYAFWACTNIGSVTLPSTAKTLGEHSFDGCSSLSSISLSNVTSIGVCAFQNCSALGDPSFSSSITSIGDYAFAYCTSINRVSVSGSNLTIGAYAFAMCNQLTTLTLGTGVKSIGDYSFSDNDLLTSVNLGSSLQTIGDHAFYRSDGFTSITIPNSVTSLTTSAFDSCTKLKTVVLGNGLTSTGTRTFNGCKALTSVTFGSNITTIGTGSFGSCKALTSITIPNSVTTISDQAFYYCTGLNEITLGTGVTSISSSAFYNVDATVYYPSNISSLANNDYGGDLTWQCTGGGNITPVTQVTISSHPSNVSVVEGNNASFSVTASGGTLSYQWQQSSNGTSWSNYWGTGYNTSKMTVSATSSLNGYKYRCVVYNTEGQSATSNTATLTVTSSLAISSHPSSTTVKDGNNATFTVTASGSNLTYQWQEYKNGSWASCWYTGYSTKTLTVPATMSMNGYKYRCIVYSGSNSLTSNAATLTVQSSLAITSNPSNVTVNEGNNATFTVAANGSGLSYQWQASSDSGSTWKDSSLSGNQTASLTVSALYSRNGYRFRCVVTDTYGTSVTSNAASLTVNAVMWVTTQPTDQTAKEGAYAYFTAAGSGNGITYQWQASKDNGANWINSGLTGNKTETLKVQATAARNGYKFRCVITDANGNTRNTNGAKLTVTGGSIPVITTQPASKYVVAGNTAKFTVAASGSSLSYQWQVSTDSGKTWKNSGMTGNKTKTLSVAVTAARNNYRFRCIVTSGSNSVTSDVATLTVFGIKTQPAAKSVSAGTTAKFTVKAVGSGLTYQWQVWTPDKQTWTNSGLTGNKTKTLSVAATAARNGYKFRCVITDSKGNKVTSSAAALTVK